MSTLKNMRLPKEVLLRNPFVIFGMTEGRKEGRKEGRQEARQEARHQGEMELVLRQLARLLGSIPLRQQRTIRNLPTTSVEALGEALLDFHSKTDLSLWLKSHSEKSESS